MTPWKFVSLHIYQLVSIILLTLMSNYCLLISTDDFTDQRGMKQDILLITKHGIEAKNYEAVSFLYKFNKILNKMNNYFFSKKSKQIFLLFSSFLCELIRALRW